MLSNKSKGYITVVGKWVMCKHITRLQIVTTVGDVLFTFGDLTSFCLPRVSWIIAVTDSLADVLSC